MADKKKKISFVGCQHLRKVLIGKGVEFEGNIDLTDTPIIVKNDIDKITDPKFKSIPNGISINKNDEKRVKIAITTQEVATQTDPIILENIGKIESELRGLKIREKSKNEQIRKLQEKLEQEAKTKSLTEKEKAELLAENKSLETEITELKKSEKELENKLVREKVKAKKPPMMTIETQTDEVEIMPLGTLNLMESDRATIQLLKDAVPWFDAIVKNGIEALKNNQIAIKKKINIAGVNPPNENVRLISEHILYINEKILENFKLIEDLNKVNTKELKEPKQGWDDTTRTLTINSSNIGQFHNRYVNKWLDVDWGLARYRNLTNLYCNSNKLTSLPTLPSSLTTLYCYNNPLTSLPLPIPPNLKPSNFNGVNNSYNRNDKSIIEWNKKFPNKLF